MNRIIVDASVLLHVFDSTEEGNFVNKLIPHIQHGDIIAAAPSFFLVEVTNILVKRKKFLPSEVKQFIKMLRESGIQFVDFSFQNIDELLEIVFQYKLTSYDALYVHLAKRLHYPLVSTDLELVQITDIGMSIEEFASIMNSNASL